MSRRFQFSLRALAIAVAFIALALGAYSYYRNNDNMLLIDQEAEGKPVRFHLRLFRPMWKGSHRIGVLVSGDNHYSWVDTIDYHRSLLVFWRADTVMPLPPPGDYFAQTLPCGDDFTELTQVFVVKPRE